MCNVTHDFNDALFRSLCDLMRITANNELRINFEIRGVMSNEEMHLWTGRLYNQFEAILDQTPLLSEHRNQPRTALGIYLTKLRTGDSDERLASLFHISRGKLERFYL